MNSKFYTFSLDLSPKSYQPSTWRLSDEQKSDEHPHLSTSKPEFPSSPLIPGPTTAFPCTNVSSTLVPYSLTPIQQSDWLF